MYSAHCITGLDCRRNRSVWHTCTSKAAAAWNKRHVSTGSLTDAARELVTMYDLDDDSAGIGIDGIRRALEVQS